MRVQNFPTDSFYIYDPKALESAYEEWKRVFPTVTPFYAVKCNPDPRILMALASFGSSFDCASRAEIDSVLKLGVTPARIIYANPCKHPLDIEWAKTKNITLTTADSVCEIEKIAGKGYEVVLRIRSDDPGCRCNLGIKYGAQKSEWKDLLEACKRLNVPVVGASFHVGSMAKGVDAYNGGVEDCILLTEMARDYGFDPNIIDIGGGFSSSTIHEFSSKINLDSKLKFIAEPGRYFAENTMTLVTLVIGIKGSGVTISESLYGAFNCMLFDHASPTPEFIGDSNTMVPRTIFGSTCDGGDIIYKTCLVPDNLKVGDWINWPSMGAYTSAAVTTFNGIPFNAREILLREY